MSTTIDKTYLRKAVTRRVVSSIVVLGFVAGMFALATWHITDIVRGMTVSYAQVTGEVIDEGEQRVREGSRRSKRWVTYRTVDIEFSVDGETYVDSIRSKDLDIGDETHVWAGPKDGGYEVFLTKPAPASVAAYIWGSIWLVLAVLSLWGVIRAFKRTAAIASFDPQGRQPDMWFTVEEVTHDPVVKKNAHPAVTLKGYSQTHEDPQAAKATITIAGKSMPPIQLAAQIPLFAVRRGEKNGPVVIYAQAENLFYSGDIVHEVVVP